MLVQHKRNYLLGHIFCVLEGGVVGVEEKGCSVHNEKRETGEGGQLRYGNIISRLRFPD